MANAIEISGIRATTHILTVLVSRAEDLPGVWVSHCLNLDIVSQGTSIRGALESVEVAITDCVQWDVEENLDPFEVRKRAPNEYWDRLTRIMQGEAVPLSEATDESQIDAVVVHYRLQVPEEAKDALQLPPAWQIAALRGQHATVHC